jgi:hypothetical protein
VFAKWETMSECRDNQEVGLEAAILERVRNSSLVKCSGADNSTGLKQTSEAMDSSRLRMTRVVGERSCCWKRSRERSWSGRK